MRKTNLLCVSAGVALTCLAAAMPLTANADESSDQDKLDKLEKQVADLRKKIEAQTDPSGIDVGGSVWLNYDNLTYDPGSRAGQGEFRFDLFRFDIEGRKGDWLFDMQYRWYQYMHVIHNAWVGYQLTDDQKIEVGISQVPFGLQPYASHSYWFGVPYYIGLEDDYDTGVKWVYDDGPWTVQAAFYKNSEYGNTPTPSRYSWDIIGGADGHPAVETNQFNGRFTYTFNHDSDFATQVGASAQLGAQIDQATNRKGNDNAWLLHARQHLGKWTVEAEYGKYDYTPAAVAGASRNRIHMGAFAGSYAVAAKGTLKVLNITRDVDVNWGPITHLRFYSDYSVIDKAVDGWQSTALHTIGCGVTSGPVYTFIDIIRGHNHHFLGEPAEVAFAQGDPDAGWNTRININIEYYF